MNNPAATAEAFFDDWFRTGDRGALRDGYLYLEGRIKEMIIRGGENISPAEIEQALLAHPAVADAVCFGVADDKYGELPAAAVTLTGDVEPRELISFCRERLAAFKVPVRGPRAAGDPAYGDRQGAAPPGRGVRGRRAGVRMKFAVLGAGAIGAYVGAALARGGADVTLIARGPHLAAMQEHGVQVRSPRGDFTAHPRRPTTWPRCPTPTWSSSR